MAQTICPLLDDKVSRITKWNNLHNIECKYKSLGHKNKLPEALYTSSL